MLAELYNDAGPTVTKSSLKKRFLGATKWTLIGHFLNQAVRFASSLILTRLLAPDLYGVMAVGYLVITGLSMASDVGLTSGAIQSKRGDEPAYLNVTWIVGIVRGVLIMLAALTLSGLVLLASPLAWLPADSVYGDQRIPALLAVLSLYGLIAGFESTRTIYARRRMQLERLVKIEVACQIVSTICILTWAWVSPTLWALAFGWLIGAALKTVLSHVALPGPPNRFQWDSSAFREVFTFGKWVFLSSTLTYLLVTGDRLLLGVFANAEEMGFYSIAMLLTGALRTAVQKITAHAALPALSEVARERSTEFKATLYRIRRPLDFVCLLAAGALIHLGEPIVRALYDPRYAAAGWMLGLLGLSLVATRLDVFEHGLVAMGRVKLLSGLSAARLVTLFLLIPLGYYIADTRGAIAGVAASFIVNAAVILAVQARTGFFDLRRELTAVPIFGVGFGAGWLVNRVLQ